MPLGRTSPLSWMDNALFKDCPADGFVLESTSSTTKQPQRIVAGPSREAVRKAPKYQTSDSQLKNEEGRIFIVISYCEGWRV